MPKYFFTSESVSAGHPDKICDAISDSILDLYLSADPNARVACECLVTTNFMVIAGEISSSASISPAQIEATARAVVRRIGYEQDGFHWETFELINRLHAQSVDIAKGVDAEGAGDQGLMFGYACDETADLMPAPIYYAHSILQQLDVIRQTDARLGPDAKSQVTYLYSKGRPVGVDTILVSTQHTETTTQEDVRELVMQAIRVALPQDVFEQWSGTLLVNPTGKFVIGGPDGDTGLTGRKIIVDTYGGASPHGGGAFSGKDPTKVDRSAAYAARYLAKNIVAAGLTHACTVQLAYAIGVAEPVSIAIDFHDRGLNARADYYVREIRKLMSFTPRAIRERFDLARPIYALTASYGHFGRPYDPATGTFPWERLDLVDQLKLL